ncbi:MAG: helix-turn-helix domain-containing protein [Citrobacter portucalensis]
MKTPLDMFHDIVAQISEGNTLLEMIYKNSEEMNEETDCGLACLIRSFNKTRETAYAYIEELAKTSQPTPANLYSHMETIIRSMDDFRASITAPKTPMLYPVAQLANLSARIQMCRENMGLSRGWIAAQLGVKPKAISVWERGTGQPDINQVTRLANIFGVEPAWLAFDVIPETSLVADPAPVEVMQGVDMSGIGKRIQTCRIELMMSHRELAAKLDIPELDTFLWETGKQMPPSSYIDKIAAVLGCGVTWLLTGKNARVSHE